MALQDLTPQLRTRLNRVEHMVGWFVFLATALLLFAFGYYIYHQAERNGWFKIKAPFFTYVNSSAGLKVGDDVIMMGFGVGKITEVEVMPPGNSHNVKVNFVVKEPYFRYLQTGGSYLKLNAGLFNNRQLEVTRGTNGYALVVTQPVTIFSNLDDLRQDVAADPGKWQLSQEVFDAQSNLVYRAYEFLNSSNLDVIAALKPPYIYAYNNTVNRKSIVASWDGRYHHYKVFAPGDETAWIRSVELPPVSDQLQAMVTQVQGALPAVLALTNKLAAILNNAANATSNLNATLAEARPMVANFAAISGQVRDPGGLGTWALGTNGSFQLQGALTNLNALLVNTDTNLNTLSDQVGLSLINLANITSNLNVQVQANSNILSSVSTMVVNSDEFVQGLKKHWLLRSAFKTKNTNAPPTPVSMKPKVIVKP